MLAFAAGALRIFDESPNSCTDDLPYAVASRRLSTGSSSRVTPVARILFVISDSSVVSGLDSIIADWGPFSG